MRIFDFDHCAILSELEKYDSVDYSCAACYAIRPISGHHSYVAISRRFILTVTTLDPAFEFFLTLNYFGPSPPISRIIPCDGEYEANLQAQWSG